MPYFHCASVELAPGSIINPGNWGRMLHLYQGVNNQVSPNAWRECILELTRQLHTPNKPSRLNCVFTVPTHAEAALFRNTHQPMNLIYEVEPIIDNPNTHQGDYDLAIAPYPQRYFQSMFDIARDYWLGQNVQRPEILFDCPVRVIARHL